MVIQKVLNNPIYGEKLKDDPETLQRFAHVLSTKDELKGTYLTTDWLETIKLVRNSKLFFYMLVQNYTNRNKKKYKQGWWYVCQQSGLGNAHRRGRSRRLGTNRK